MAMYTLDSGIWVESHDPWNLSHEYWTCLIYLKYLFAVYIYRIWHVVASNLTWLQAGGGAPQDSSQSSSQELVLFTQYKHLVQIIINEKERQNNNKLRHTQVSKDINYAMSHDSWIMSALQLNSWSKITRQCNASREEWHLFKTEYRKALIQQS